MEPGDGLDNDCDGNFDEEIRDGKDNDRDGKVDEDLEKVMNFVHWKTSDKYILGQCLRSWHLIFITSVYSE